MTPGEWEKAVEYNYRRLKEGLISAEDVTRLTLYAQERHQDLAEDGQAGPRTLRTMKELYKPEPPPEQFESWDGPECRQPKSRREVYDMFGNPGESSEDNEWTRQNIMYCHKSRGTRLPGVPDHRWVPIHKLIYPYLREALERAHRACPDYKIERIWGHQWRTIRNRAGGRLSMHAWGIAVDVNSHLNYGRNFSRGQAPEAWSASYWGIWPEGLPEGFVRAFQSCGFAWGSDWDEDGTSKDHTYLDPMHFEWVARDGDSLRV